MAKIRNGFVSNSSSSSFVVKNKDNFESMIKMLEEAGGDYYIMDDTLYTSCISDGLELYNDIYDLSDYDISTAWTEPYDTKDFYELEGERGVASVWIEKNKCTDLNKIEEGFKSELYDYVRGCAEDYEIETRSDIYYMSISDIVKFMGDIFGIVGIYKNKDENFYED